MADSAAVRKQKAAIKARGLKAGYSGSKSSVDATFKRKQDRAKARGKSAAAHAKAPGQIKKGLPASGLPSKTIAAKAKASAARGIGLAQYKASGNTTSGNTTSGNTPRGALTKPNRLGFSEKKPANRIVLKPGG